MVGKLTAGLSTLTVFVGPIYISIMDGQLLKKVNIPSSLNHSSKPIFDNGPDKFRRRFAGMIDEPRPIAESLC